MKILIFLFIILINFVSILKADSIKNYQIENMSIGDSALDYFTKKEIRTEKKIELNILIVISLLL